MDLPDFDFAAAAELQTAPPTSKSGGGVLKTVLFLSVLAGGAYWAYADYKKKGKWFYQRWIALFKDASELQKIQTEIEQNADGRGYPWAKRY